MGLPEYLCLFSHEGSIEVEVKIKDFNSTIVNRRMQAAEITKLISEGTNEFITKMTFDEWTFEVYKYQIDPIKKRLTIYARQFRSL